MNPAVARVPRASAVLTHKRRESVGWACANVEQVFRVQAAGRPWGGVGGGGCFLEDKGTLEKADERGPRRGAERGMPNNPRYLPNTLTQTTGRYASYTRTAHAAVKLRQGT